MDKRLKEAVAYGEFIAQMVGGEVVSARGIDVFEFVIRSPRDGRVKKISTTRDFFNWSRKNG